MSRRNVMEVREVPPHIGGCDFKSGWICERPGTTYFEWDVDGVRDRGVYCDEHAALELEEQARAEYEALTNRFDEAVPLSQGAEGQPVEHLWRERSRELAELREPQRGGHATSQAGDADTAVLQAASAALERRAAGLRAMSAAVPADMTLDHAGEAEEAVARAEMLRTLDPAEPLGQRRIDALQAGLQALHTEVDGWRNLAEVATTADWRAEFDARAKEAERLWKGAGELQRQLEERDRSIEQECER
jgi:hypothetical protein